MEPKVKDSASYTVLAQPSASTSTSVSIVQHYNFIDVDNANVYHWTLQFGRGGLLSEVEVVEVTTESKCATWSHCPARSNWEIIMMLKNQTPEDLHTRIGFAITVNIRGRKGSKHEVEANSDMESYHDLMDLPLFIDLLERGSNFTKLELEGDFFNNVDLCPEDMTPNSVVTQLITIQNLKTLSIKAKLTLPLKGLDEATQHGYYSLHRDHCNAFKSRAARNLWYIFKAFECPILSVLEIMDCMEWEDPDLIESGFFYWDQPLMSFLQRHAPTLRSLKTSPIIGMQIDDMTNGNFEADASIPIVEDLLFWTKLRLKNFSKTPDSQKEITFQIEVEKTLRPWRKFLEAQNNLKTLILITDEDSPWTLVRRDFVNVATKNSALEAVMVALYGDEEFRKAHGLPEQQPNKGTIKDYQIDAAVVHGMLSLRILSIGCYGNDPQVKNFSLINLHLLPGTLDTIQFFGVRVMATELERFCLSTNFKTFRKSD